MTQGLSHRSVKAETPVQSQGPASRIRGGSSDIGTDFLLVFRFYIIPPVPYTQSVTEAMQC